MNQQQQQGNLEGSLGATPFTRVNHQQQEQTPPPPPPYQSMPTQNVGVGYFQVPPSPQQPKGTRGAVTTDSEMPQVPHEGPPRQGWLGGVATWIAGARGGPRVAACEINQQYLNQEKATQWAMAKMPPLIFAENSAPWEMEGQRRKKKHKTREIRTKGKRNQKWRKHITHPPPTQKDRQKPRQRQSDI